jgi:hypothetical protein
MLNRDLSWVSSLAPQRSRHKLGQDKRLVTGEDVCQASKDSVVPPLGVGDNRVDTYSRYFSVELNHGNLDTRTRRAGIVKHSTVAAVFFVSKERNRAGFVTRWGLNELGAFGKPISFGVAFGKVEVGGIWLDGDNTAA